MRFTKSFAVRRGFLLNPNNWVKFTRVLVLRGMDDEIARAHEAGEAAFGPRYAPAMKRLGAKLEWVGRDKSAFGLISTAIDLMGAEPLHAFLFEMWPREFDQECRGAPIISDMKMAPWEIKNYVRCSEMPTYELETLFTEGVFEEVELPGFFRQPIETFIAKLYERPAPRLISYCLWAIGEATWSREDLEAAARNVYGREKD